MPERKIIGEVYLMKRFKSFIAALVVALFSATLLLPVAACGPNGANGSNTVYVTSLGGMPLKNVTVELFNGDDGLGAKITDEEGKVSYDLISDKEYTAKLTGTPDGFICKPSYNVKGADATTYIRLESQIIEGTPKRAYSVGDVMYDFEQTYYTYDGSNKTQMRTVKKKLSDFFEEGKKAVMIDFFYNTCSWCQREYPYLKAAYEKYSDDLEILGINDISESNPDETLSELQRLVVEDKIPYLVCKDKSNVGVWFNALKSGYPTAIMIDRYGIIADWYAGGQLDQNWWEAWFEKYTSPDYSQDINNDSNGGEVFVPDEPDVTMPDSSLISSAINNTNKNIVFSSENMTSSNGWPWVLTEDGTAIYPANSGHRSTMGTIYAQLELNEGEALAFDYKMSTNAENDYFYVTVDARKGTGRQISMLTGVQDWQTGYAYAALEKGTHEIAFSYYRSMANAPSSIDDKIYINNLRIVSVNEMNANLTDRNETLEIPYFATREYRNKQFTVIDDVYIASDGYYHIGTAATAKVNDPYLMLDLTHSVPYFGSHASSLYNLIQGGVIIDGINYTEKFQSYVLFSGNSDYHGLIPVTEDMGDMLMMLYEHLMEEENAPDEYWSDEGWLQFCVSYRQYGVQKELKDPIKGLAYFSAFEAKDTTDIVDNYVKVEKGTGQFIFDEKTGEYVDVEGTKRADEGEYNWNEGLNTVMFEKIIMPRGYMFKFVPKTDGVYRIQALDCYYVNELTSAIVYEYTDAQLFDDSIDLSSVYAKSLKDSDEDRFSRDGNELSFKIYHYLKANKTYYVSVNFRTVEALGEFAFRIDKIADDEYSYIDKTTAGYYTLDVDNKMVLPLFVDPAFDETHTVGGEKVWYDKQSGSLIYLDFTQYSLMFNNFTIEQILYSTTGTGQFTFDIAKEKFVTSSGEEIDISLNLEKEFGGVDKIPESLKGLEIKDYTDIMKQYFAKATEGISKDEEMYGLLPVNAELYGILQLYNAKFMGYDTDTEWLKACCYKVVVKGNN